MKNQAKTLAFAAVYIVSVAVLHSVGGLGWPVSIIAATGPLSFSVQAFAMCGL